MSAKAKNKRGPSKVRRNKPKFINASELAHELGGADTKTLDDWIAAGTLPPPHSRPGERTRLWKRAYFDAYVETGKWPDEAFKEGKGGA